MIRLRRMLAVLPVAIAGAGCAGEGDDLDVFLDDLDVLDVAVTGMTESNGGASQ